MDDVEVNVTSEKAIVKERLSEPKENGFHQVDEDDSGKEQAATPTAPKEHDTTTTTSQINKLGKCLHLFRCF